MTKCLKLRLLSGEFLLKKEYLDRLIKKGALSPVFSDAYWVIKQLGNEAAHGDNKERFEYEVEEIINYISEIIRYVWWIFV